MSRKTTGEWLLSHHSHFAGEGPSLQKKKTKTIAISSGKGGVGKTSTAIKFAKSLVERGERVLLIDCDYNLSNTALKLGYPINDNFFDLISNRLNFEDTIYKDGNFHLLSACNGNLEIFENGLSLEAIITDIISVHGPEYDTVILDCPAGLSREVCSLSSYCDYRFVIVTPDKSSITDSYSLIKVLTQKYGIRDHHLIFNKVSSSKQYERLTSTFLKTAEHYLDCRLKVLGAIPFFRDNVDLFDRELLKVAGSQINKSFNKVILKFTEEDIGSHPESLAYCSSKLAEDLGSEHDVQSI